jgi:hypothetical protein
LGASPGTPIASPDTDRISPSMPSTASGVATVHDDANAVCGPYTRRGRADAMRTSSDDSNFACTIGIRWDSLEFGLHVEYSSQY